MKKQVMWAWLGKNAPEENIFPIPELRVRLEDVKAWQGPEWLKQKNEASEVEISQRVPEYGSWYRPLKATAVNLCFTEWHMKPSESFQQETKKIWLNIDWTSIRHSE